MPSAFVAEPGSITPDPRESSLVRLAIDLGAADAGGPLSAAEARLVTRANRLMASTPRTRLATARRALRAGLDPLGDEFCAIRTPSARRESGAIYTPPALVQPMVDWVMDESPARVIDPPAVDVSSSTLPAASPAPIWWRWTSTRWLP